MTLEAVLRHLEMYAQMPPITAQLFTLPLWSLALPDSVFQGDDSGVELKIISAVMC